MDMREKFPTPNPSAPAFDFHYTYGRDPKNLCKVFTRQMHLMAPPRWARVEDFVRQCVAETGASSDSSEFRAQMVWTTRLVRWATGTASLALDRAEIFDPKTIAAFLQNSAYARDVEVVRAWKAMSAALKPAAVASLSFPGHGHDQPSPLTAADFTRLEEWADTAADPGRRRDADAMLVFCLGAGLTGRELFAARARDLASADSGTFIFVPGARPRTVPVHARWEDRLRRRFRDTSLGSFLIAPTRSPTARFADVARCVVDGCEEVPASAWLRAQWRTRTERLLDADAAAYFAGDRLADDSSVINLRGCATLLRGNGLSW
jgi:hypothetical protein